jgi:3-methyladenine DNA glycosylase AlkC
MGLGKTALNPIVHVSEFKLSVKFQPEFTKYGLFEVTKL